MPRPLSPCSVRSYDRVLERAFGPERTPGPWAQDPRAWPMGCRKLLRAAIRRRCEDLGISPAPWLAEIPLEYEVRREVVIPGEEEARGYETAAMSLPPGQRALALLALKLGFRAEELCALSREAVKRAVKTGDLIFLRKGGRERTFRVEKILPLLEELLTVPARRPRRVNLQNAPRAWKVAGEILSSGGAKAQYNALWRLVKLTGARVGLKLRPHLLRHAFATRMARDGANLFIIQSAMNHRDIRTTQRYVHPDADDIAKFIRA